MDPVSGKLSHSWDMSDINDINVVASGHTGEVQQPDHGVLAFSGSLGFFSRWDRPKSRGSPKKLYLVPPISLYGLWMFIVDIS